MNSSGIFSVDIGTSSVRTALFDGGGKLRRVSQEANPPNYLSNGRVEQDASTWLGCVMHTLSECSSAARELGLSPAALSLTSFRSAVIPVDREGAALGPAIMWQDTRTNGMCEELSSENATVYRKSGLKISPVPSAIKFRWIKKEAPELYARSYKLLGVQDYLIRALTGNFLTDRSFGSRTNLLNLETLEWDDDLVRIFGIDKEKLCDLVDQGSICGSLSPAAANAAGLPRGLPVISAGGDQQCAALGLGLYDSDRLVANTGTGSYVIGQSAKPVFDPDMRIVCNVAAVRGAYIIEAATLTAGTVYRWFSENFYDGIQPGYERINSEVDAVPPGANGVILLPHFKGAGAPYWNPDSRGLFFNLSLSTTRADMARAVLEGIASEMADNILLLESLSNPVDSIRIAGGLCRFETFDQMQADMYGKTVVRSNETEATALGAWISASLCLGLEGSYESAYAASMSGNSEKLFFPDASNFALYESVRTRRRSLYSAVYGGGIRE